LILIIILCAAVVITSSILLVNYKTKKVPKKKRWKNTNVILCRYITMSIITFLIIIIVNIAFSYRDNHILKGYEPYEINHHPDTYLVNGAEYKAVNSGVEKVYIKDDVAYEFVVNNYFTFPISEMSYELIEVGDAKEVF